MPAQSDFTTFADDYLKSWFEFMPPVASSLGLHEYDGKTPDLSKAAIEQRVDYLKQALNSLGAIGTNGFDKDMRLDYDLLRQAISAELFRFDEQRESTDFPMFTMFLADVTPYIKRDYAPVEERVRKLVEYEHGIPRLIDQAKALLEPPLSRPILNVSIEMCSGQAAYMSKNLAEIIASQVNDQQLLAEFKTANGAAVDAMESYIGFLKAQLENAKEDFAIGARMFERLLAVNELVDLPLERVLEVGRANLEANKQAFINTARLIDPHKDVREVAESVASDHPTAESLVSETASMLEE